LPENINYIHHNQNIRQAFCLKPFHNHAHHVLLAKTIHRSPDISFAKPCDSGTPDINIYVSRCPDFRSEDLQISRSPDLRISKSPNLRISKSPNLQTCPDLRMSISLAYHLNTNIFTKCSVCNISVI
jgi:hypothetical protein